MENKRHRKYTEEFKQEALRLLQSGEKSASEIERDLGITDGLLGKWKIRYQMPPGGQEGQKLTLSDLERAKREICRLERELTQMREERDILKKVVSIFSRSCT